MQIFSYKICCDLPEARLVASKFSKIVLGGTAALHTLSGVGGGNFLAINDEVLIEFEVGISNSIRHSVFVLRH